MHENFLIAMGLSIFAGLSTGIGSAIAFFIKDKNTKILTFAMGFAAGVMLYVSFMEMFPHALSELEGHQYIGLISFFGGMLLVGAIDKLVPHEENPHEFMSEDREEEAAEKLGQNEIQKKKLMRVGLLTALALALHNFPEGMASFVAALEDVNLGITIAIAIAIHNIPEGIAVSMPIYYATGDRKKAFFYSFLSGVVEPLGAIVGYLILMPFIDPTVMAILLSGVAGIMVFISLDQLLPAAEEYGEHHLSIYGVMIGMAVMAVSLMLL
jgi:ZIP family zinc transporter